ncbi:MAG TPA: LysR family transcriptional regulator [Pararobbsia sp.]|jgi:DNA-binding transcriptional LysR family regulator|nr:LysR family transcriptional regulator [Pararobbsia sp.]
MELRHLRYFLAVAEEGQFTRAAERLAMQQPPLSQQIRLFEEEMGFELFVRNPRGVTLTPAGAALADEARVLLEGIQGAVGRARRIARGEMGTLSVGLTSSASFHPLTTDIIRVFRAALPDVGVELEELNAAELIERLANAQVHVGFMRKPVDPREGIVYQRIVDESMVVVLPIGHPLLKHQRAAKPKIRLEALAQEEFILVRRPGAPGMYADFLAACRLAGFTPRIAVEVPRMLSAINAVAAGLGVTLVPASMVRYHCDNAVYCPLAQPELLGAPLNLAYATTLNNSTAQRFIKFATERAAALGTD